MLRSQLVKHNFLRRRQIFLGELLLVSVLFHTIFFFFLLVVYSGYRYSKHITVRRSGALPTYFVSPATMVQSGKGTQNTAHIKKVRTGSKKIPSTVIKNDTAKKTVAKSQQKKQPIQNKQQVAQKQKPKEETKKTPAKQQQKHEVAKKQQPPQKEDEQKKIDGAQSQETTANLQQPNMAFNSGAVPITEGIDFDTLQIEQYIQNEISHYWHPPIGLPDDLTCKIRVQIDNMGTVSDAIIEESSGILVYDLSARFATSSLSLPCWAWGKEFTINFR